MDMKSRASGLDMKTTRHPSNVDMIELSGRLDANTVPPVATWLEQVTSTAKARVLVNLENTSFIDSTALAALVQALKRCQQNDGELVLCGLRRPVYMIFELTRLDKAFNIFVDEEHALKAFAN
jgi:anti-sigma B factor antagonist